MGLCFGTSSRPPPPQQQQLPPPAPLPSPGWTDLPTGLAGLIFSSLPSHHDRLSFLAVCSQWRIGALGQYPLPPWQADDVQVYYFFHARHFSGCEQ
uniref:F-box domain-containing protein n=1 Tax=Oryza punctata TaxID=4537 RepID=A0A0E0MJT4_ORYPU